MVLLVEWGRRTYYSVGGPMSLQWLREMRDDDAMMADD